MSIAAIETFFREVDWSVAIPAIATVISLGALWFSARQAKAAKDQAEISHQQSEIARHQALLAQQTLNQGRLAGLYSSFDLANQAILGNPDLLYDVHGLAKSVPPEEVARLVYLSILLDAHQEHWTDLYEGDCSKVLEKLRETPTFLTRILSVKANHARWELIKPIFYHKFDNDFVCVIDALIAEEQEKAHDVDKASAKRESAAEERSAVEEPAA